jgi:hypothetical protein
MIDAGEKVMPQPPYAARGRLGYKHCHEVRTKG